MISTSSINPPGANTSPVEPVETMIRAGAGTLDTSAQLTVVRSRVARVRTTDHGARPCHRARLLTCSM